MAWLLWPGYYGSYRGLMYTQYKPVKSQQDQNEFSVVFVVYDATPSLAPILLLSVDISNNVMLLLIVTTIYVHIHVNHISIKQ